MKALGESGTGALVEAINANKTKVGTFAEYKPDGIHKGCPYFCTDHNCIYYNGLVYGEPSTVFEIVVDPAEYDNIIDSESGIIKTLTSYQFRTNMTRTELKQHIDRIKFVAFKTSDGARRTYMNITFTMPQYGIFCGYSFNKTDSDHFGVGYATFSWKDENTCRVTSISSTMYIDGHDPNDLDAMNANLATLMSEVATLKSNPVATQADWNITNSSNLAYIRNKPSLLTGTLRNNTSWSSINVENKLITGTFNSNIILSFKNSLPLGENVTLIMKNNDTISHIVDFTSFTIRNLEDIEIEPNEYLEVNVCYDGYQTYLRAAPYND